MIQLVKNKHFTVLIEESCSMITDKKLQVNVDFIKHSTYATNFQMKKALKRKIILIMRQAIERYENNE
jgi:hypothetical protein